MTHMSQPTARLRYSVARDRQGRASMTTPDVDAEPAERIPGVAMLEGAG